ncbi:MAG TPA: SDR family NAD(P)-dependent oxidoreductase, partial [Homoserinimonas sp.]|nr:SDR family NAD(P)-dependent oxidoreductase [Homoserinimonas sp.]
MAEPLTIVTGGSRGIGAAICRTLAADGHDVVVGYRENILAAEEVVADVQSRGRRALAVKVDTTVESSVAELFARASEFGTVSGLVNSAGSAEAVGPLTHNDLAAIRRDIDVNLM